MNSGFGWAGPVSSTSAHLGARIHKVRIQVLVEAPGGGGAQGYHRDHLGVTSFPGTHTKAKQVVGRVGFFSCACRALVTTMAS